MSKPIASKTENSTLVRARFGPGMLLQHDDLEQLNSYTRDLSRLMFRSFFGCGVVCGLVVKAEAKCGKAIVTVGCGLALDCTGDPVYVPKKVEVTLAADCDTEIEGPLWVVLCGTAKCCAPRTAVCPSDDDEPPSVCTRERDRFEIRVVSECPKCACGCCEPEEPGGEEEREDQCLCVDPALKCYVDHYAGKCGCNCGGDGSDCDCDCDCILLARLDKSETGWTVDHRVRRFIRPVLMRDPQVELENQARLVPDEPAPGADPIPAPESAPAVKVTTKMAAKKK